VDQAYVGEFLAGIVYLTVGVRLLRLGRRTGEAPERLLGGVFLWMGVSAGLYVLPTFPAFESMWTSLNFAGRLAYIPPPVMLAVFTRRVFRPDDRWGNWLVWVSSITLITGVGGSALGGDLEGFSIRSGWFWLEWVGFTVPFAWAGSEAFVQYRQARRRMQLELCDRLVCNRYLLWAVFGVLQLCMSLVLLPQYYEYEMTSEFTAKWDILYGGFGIISLVMIWTVFFPPAFYRRWIANSDLVAAVAGGDAPGETARSEAPA
jgi:hypothetical protein